eukprot:TRINITY_DN71644_c0_g1_i1.p1 TRINITY_DN71644_c0_g1~~TRINITY_DN71644_c0_g1_i1.p1  ORF type:complete len:778 (+),score=156.82 TRINITY_DN71644_c0_g1_i1:146-2479(+)
MAAVAMGPQPYGLGGFPGSPAFAEADQLKQQDMRRRMVGQEAARAQLLTPQQQIPGAGRAKADYGPDGLAVEGFVDPQVEARRLAEEQERAAEKEHLHHMVEMPEEEGWFQAESNRMEQERLARVHLEVICRAVDERHAMGACPDRRWTNDPDVFPDLQLHGGIACAGVVPFPPHDQQFFVCGQYEPEETKLRPSAIPCHMQDEDGNSTWVRLVDFSPNADACHVFDETVPNMTHCGKVLQGALDNGHFVEALNAITIRPRLARQLFYCWDVRRSVYIVRLYKHGTWMRVEIDDYVPVGAPGRDDRCPDAPICCRADTFPHVMWPSLVEKAYAKIHTTRGSLVSQTPMDRGGWETLGGGGSLEEALGDLTGGVAGRFSTTDVTADRLFIYIHELQRDTLFVCRVNEAVCGLHDVKLNPYYPNVVNRAVCFEGRMFVQMFSGAPGVYDGGLQDTSVPWALINNTEYPERTRDGFFWITAEDFHQYYDTIFECRLVNSGDVSIRNMPPPRMPGVMSMHGLPQMGMMGMMPSMAPGMPMPGMAPGMMAPGMMGPGMLAGPGGVLPASQPWFEWVYANGGDITRHNMPEFSVRVPDYLCPCEIVCSIEQVDLRMAQTSPDRPRPAAVLCKVYENVSGSQYYSKDLVCKSNWLPIRDAMVAFCVRNGGEFKIVAEFTDERGAPKTKINRMIFRCYSTKPNVTVSAGASSMRHALVNPLEPPRAVKWTLVGCQREELYDAGILPRYQPQYLDDETDSMRKPEHDLNPGIGALTEEFRQDCSVM